MVDNPKKILIVRTDRLGDVILSTPVIKNLREFFPEAFIGFMCRPYTKDVLEENPYLDKVIIYDKCNKQKAFGQQLNLHFVFESKSLIGQ